MTSFWTLIDGGLPPTFGIRALLYRIWLHTYFVFFVIDLSGLEVIAGFLRRRIEGRVCRGMRRLVDVLEPIHRQITVFSLDISPSDMIASHKHPHLLQCTGSAVARSNKYIRPHLSVKLRHSACLVQIQIALVQALTCFVKFV